MEKLKFTLLSIIALAAIGLLLYWSFGTLESGTEHQMSQRIEELEEENDILKEENKELKNELLALQPEVAEVEPQTVTENPTPAPSSTTYKHQALIDDLQELVDNKVNMKLKSVGARVGTVQKFLNIYNNTSNKIDNDYGASTKSAVLDFQKDQGLTADGEAGSTTFSKMISWLKQQS